jgi:hypothetical protein
MKDKDKDKFRPKVKTITVEAQPVSAAIVPQEPKKYKPGMSPAAQKALRPFKAGESRPYHSRKSALDCALESFLTEEIRPHNGRDRKDNRKLNKKSNRYSNGAPITRAHILAKAVYMQALQGLGKGKLAELIFERVGGKPGQTVYTEELSAAYIDPKMRKQRIKELQRTLKMRIST